MVRRGRPRQWRPHRNAPRRSARRASGREPARRRPRRPRVGADAGAGRSQDAGARRIPSVDWDRQDGGTLVQRAGRDPRDDSESTRRRTREGTEVSRPATASRPRSLRPRGLFLFAVHCRHMEFVFFYGTLMAGFDRRRRAAMDAKLSFIGRGWISASLFDLGLYPAAIPSPDGTVWGELYEIADPATVLP